MYVAVITYRLNNKIYHDSVGVELETTYKQVRGMFEMNHAMEGDLNECQIISIDRYLR